MHLKLVKVIDYEVTFVIDIYVQVKDVDVVTNDEKEVSSYDDILVDRTSKNVN